MSVTELKNGELDLLVAEKVMGRFPCAEWKSIYGGWLAGPCWKHETSDHDGKDCFPANAPPKYSTNIKLAWEVMERLKPQYASDRYVWRRFIAALPKRNGLFNLSDKQAAETICRAALVAVNKD